MDDPRPLAVFGIGRRAQRLVDALLKLLVLRGCLGTLGRLGRVLFVFQPFARFLRRGFVRSIGIDREVAGLKCHDGSCGTSPGFRARGSDALCDGGSFFVTGAPLLFTRCRAVLFSPIFGRIDPREIVEWILADRLPVRFQLQMHKFIWTPTQRGV